MCKLETSHVACDNESAREGAYGSFVRVQGCPPASSAGRRAAGESEEGGTMRVRHQSLPVEQRLVSQARPNADRFQYHAQCGSLLTPPTRKGLGTKLIRAGVGWVWLARSEQRCVTILWVGQHACMAYGGLESFVMPPLLPTTTLSPNLLIFSFSSPAHNVGGYYFYSLSRYFS